LVNSRTYRTAGWIRQHVAGYDNTASDHAFQRMFERDKRELRDLDIPIETSIDGEGYRIRPGDFALPPLDFSAAEAAALAVAARVWETSALGEAGSSAIRKLADGGIPEIDLEPDGSAEGLLARVRTAEPAFADLFTALRTRRTVR